MSSKQPPTAMHAERAVLGACLLNEQAVYSVRELGLLPEHFANREHQRLYEGILRLADASHAVDSVKLCSEVSADIPTAASLIASLTSAVPTSVYADDYARDVLDCYARRELITACRLAAEVAYKKRDARESAIALIERLQDICGAKMRASIETPRQLLPALERRIDTDGPSAAGFYTGIYELDNVVRGLRSKQLWVVGGRPSSGKSAFLLTLAYYMCHNYGPALIASLDATKEEVMDRLVRIVIPHEEYADVYRHHDREGLASLIGCHSHRVRDIPLYIDDTTAHVEDMIYSWRAHIARHPDTKWIGVDYFQQIQTRQRFRARLDALNYVLARLKAFRLETGIPIILLSQLNRSDWNEKTGPQLHHLKDTGTLNRTPTPSCCCPHWTPKSTR